jgi:lysophospholipase L1-like esterase
MARTLIRGGLLVACVLALGLAVGSVPARAGSVAKDRADSARHKTHRCATRRVRFHAGVVRRISIQCSLRKRALARRVNRAPARIVRRPAHGAILDVNRPASLVRYRNRAGFSGRDSFAVVRRSGGLRWRMVVRVEVLPPPPPKCESEAKKTNYQTPVQLEVTCRGTEIQPLSIAARPSAGTVGTVLRGASAVNGGSGSSRTLTATYTPPRLYVGADEMRVAAKNPGGRTEIAAKVEVQAWRMRALGDSATAGFGFLGSKAKNGKEIEVAELEECSPPKAPNPPNDRCSSNSELEKGATGPASWSPDSGLANGISWAAQFANGWQGGGHITAPLMFQNHAVTGSTPAEWLMPGNPLHKELEAIVKEDPDLIAFTLGVNPLLGLFLEEKVEQPCIEKSKKLPELEKCIKPYFQKLAVRERLETIYKQLLGAPDAEVVTFQYHLAYPWIAAALDNFEPWQVEALINYLNAQIALAVSTVKSSVLPTQASRLTLIEAQLSPTEPAVKKVPRFNLGGPANANQPWKGSFECGAGGFKVDGESHQSTWSQSVLPGKFNQQFCKGTAWTIEADTGIHPNKTGYEQFAKALREVVVADRLVPQLP